MSDRGGPNRAVRSGLFLFAAAAIVILAGIGAGAAFTALGSSDGEARPSDAGADRFARTDPAKPPGDAESAILVSGTPRSQSVEDISSARRTPTVTAALRVQPSVVTVRTVRTVQSQDMFSRLFGTPGRSQVEPGLGSGFAIDDEGTIITNAHVVRGAERIEVVDAAGQRYDAQLAGSDEFTDIAIVTIPAGRVPPAPLGTSSNLFIGEPAVALGNPSGYALRNSEPTVTSGVISGVGRDIRQPDGDGQLPLGGREVIYADMIQTDASINPGNSGGPLANADGEVVGVNSSIFSRSGGSEGLGFAIPIDRALAVAADFIEFGRARRPWAGLQVLTDWQSSESVFGKPVVADVVDGTPAADAGLQPGDEILALNGRPVHHDLDWEVGLLDAGVGSTVEVSYRRNGRTLLAHLELEETPTGQAELVEVLAGLQLITVTESIRRERSLAHEYGALIASVGERAWSTGLREGDVILEVNRNAVRSAEDAAELFQYYTRVRDSWVRLYIARGTETGYLRPFRVR